MNITGVSNSPYASVTGSPKNTESSPLQFKDIFETSKKDAISASNKSEEINKSQWTITTPDGKELTAIDIGASLTASDKALFGWPSQDETIMTLAAHTALDRNDGTLKGPITKDYLLGNSQKDIFGLIERFPAGALEKNSVASLMHRLS